MKKTLLLQTALVAAAGVMLVADASFAQVKAEPLGVTVGGYMTRTFKVVDRDDNGTAGVAGGAAGVATPQQDRSATAFGAPDAEIWFNLRAVLDNGLRVGGRVELEAATDGDQIDESYVWFENDMGRIELGSTDRVASKMNYFSPNTTIPGQGTTQVSENSVYIAPSAATNGTTNQAGGVSMWFANASNDSEGINVYSSSNRYFGSKAGKGLQVGVSFSPDACQDNIAPCNTPMPLTNNGSAGKNYQVAANYLESFGDVNLALYAGYINAKTEGVAKNLTGWQAGAQLAYNLGGGASIAVGGGYKSEEVNATVDRKAYVIGVMYLTNGSAPGSIGIGADYWKAKGEEVGQADDTGRIFQVGVSYQLATGIRLYGGAGTYEWEDGANAITAESKANFGLLGVNLTF